MHRHGYKGRKFGRKRDQRKALLASLAESLVSYGSITTTQPKAKELVPYVEHMITRAKSGSLADRRLVLKTLSTSSAHKLFDEIAPKLKGRVSGHLRIKKSGAKKGDNSPLASVSFVDNLNANTASKDSSPSKDLKKPAKKVEVSETEAEHPREHIHETSAEIKPTAPRGSKQAPRRTGVRGNR